MTTGKKEDGWTPPCSSLILVTGSCWIILFSCFIVCQSRAMPLAVIVNVLERSRQAISRDNRSTCNEKCHELWPPFDSEPLNPSVEASFCPEISASAVIGSLLFHSIHSVRMLVCYSETTIDPYKCLSMLAVVHWTFYTHGGTCLENLLFAAVKHITQDDSDGGNLVFQRQSETSIGDFVLLYTSLYACMHASFKPLAHRVRSKLTRIWREVLQLKHQVSQLLASSVFATMFFL